MLLYTPYSRLVTCPANALAPAGTASSPELDKQFINWTGEVMMLIYTKAFPYNEFWQVVRNTNNNWAGVRRYVYCECCAHNDFSILDPCLLNTFKFVTWNGLNAINLSFKWFSVFAFPYFLIHSKRQKVVVNPLQV